MKVGDYVRTKNLGIFKIDEFCSDIEYDYIKNDKKGILINKKEIVKSSPNIIDLIEVGDIIVYKTDIGTIRVQDVHNSVVMSMIKSKEIEVLSIVTKEQFESMKYEVN